MTPGSRRACGVLRLTCAIALLALTFLAVAPPRSADACLPFGTWTYYNCQGKVLATCYVQTNCVSCCNGPITGWCTRTHTPGSPSCAIVGD